MHRRNVILTKIPTQCSRNRLQTMSVYGREDTAQHWRGEAIWEKGNESLSHMIHENEFLVA
jgi:hypothetical protein